MHKTNKSPVLTIIAFVLTFGLIYYAGKNIDDMEKFIASWGYAAPFISVALYGILSITPIPTDPISVVNGALFGPVVGFLTSWMGNNVAALIEYVLGKGIGSVTHFEDKKKSLPWGLSNAPVNSVWFLIGGRFVPGFGSKIVSILAGVYSVSVWRYIWTTAVANVVGAALYALGGAEVIKFLSK